MSRQQESCRFSIVPFALTVAQPGSADPEIFAAALNAKLKQGGSFLRHAPLVLDLDLITKPVCIADLTNRASQLGFRVAGLATSDHAAYEEQAAANGISIIGGARSQKPDSVKARTATQIVEHTVRSGQQAYAHDGDLTAAAGVNPGGEVVAQGCIHVFGRLRGRAMAGAGGDAQARIFCTCLEAELVSIAGVYQVLDGDDQPCWKGPAEIRLHGGSLKIIKR